MIQKNTYIFFDLIKFLTSSKFNNIKIDVYVFIFILNIRLVTKTSHYIF